MKKVIVSIVFAALIFQGTANAAVIKGSSKSCKVGTVKLDSKYKYNCVKSGVWKRTLIPIKKSQPAPKPTPTPTPTPTIQPVEPVKSTAVEEPKTPVVLDQKSLIFPNVAKTISSIVNPKSLNLKYFVDEGFSKKYEEYIVSGHSRIENSFGGYITKDIKVSVIMSYDKNFIMDQFYKMAQRGEVSQAFANSQLQTIPHFFPSVVVPQFSGGWATWENDTYVITYIGNPDLIIREHHAITGMHELWHVVQRNLNPNLIYTLPCWIIEGQPNMIGASLYSLDTDINGSVRMMYSMGRGTTAGLNLKNIESGQQGSRVQGGSACSLKGEYEQGAVANAYLVNKFGFDSVIQFVKESGDGSKNTGGWVEVFSRIFGMSVDDFYKEVESYLKWFYNM